MPNYDGTGPRSESGGRRDGRGRGKGRDVGRGTGRKTGGGWGIC